MKKLDDSNMEILLSDVNNAPPPYYGVRRIAASGIGNPCDAFLALSLRSFPDKEVTAQQQRRMDLGKILEDEVVKDMRLAGFPVRSKHPETGRQFLLEGFERHLKAYADGFMIWEDAETEPVEIKSMSAKRFNAVRKKGLQKAEAKYYDQVVTVMGLAKRESCLFVAINKDNSEYMIRRIPFDEERWAFLKARVERVLSGHAEKSIGFLCKLCPKAGACLRGESPPPLALQCHHCKFASPDVEGKWWCGKKEGFATGVCEAFEMFSPD